MHLYRSPTPLHRIAGLDLEAVSIGSVIAAAVPVMSPIALQASTTLALTLAVFATPIAAVLGARTLVRRRTSLR